MRPSVLISDLDGTLIPKPIDKVQRGALNVIKAAFERGEIQSLVYATGRHLSSVLEVIKETSLPIPTAMIADVGSQVYTLEAGTWVSSQAYQADLNPLKDAGWDQIESLISGIPHCYLQDAASINPCKVSFYIDKPWRAQVTTEAEKRLKAANICVSIISSYDIHSDWAFLDIMPMGVSKAHAIRWWLQNQGLDASAVVYAGDSGNDQAVFASGIPSVIVANATAEVFAWHAAQCTDGTRGLPLYVSKQCMTTGVVDGCRHFGLLPHL
jgi:sucrose-6F-phosphate phosphohydrolase